ncbi:MAG: mandelate racemase/muconate lactonizing enzyme family protein [Planctomycetota bacterium]|nr:MAG: mandelate racemase/muconate lactonizing enzyme family protein [Planctomycetota bacterium]
MKITDLRTFVVGNPWKNWVFVKLYTDEGLTGLGEATLGLATKPAVGDVEELAPHVIGEDPLQPEKLWFKMHRARYLGHSIGMSAIEQACWDILGKALNQPVYQLLGGAVRDKIKAYANGWYTVEREPKAFHEAAKKVIAKGYKALKVDPFGAGLYEMERSEKNRSVSLIEAIRDSVGPDVEILIEMHGRFSPATAIDLSHDLEKFKPSWVEEPVPPDNLEAMAKAAAKINIPVATGERIHTRFETRRLLELGAIDVLQTDITESMGLLEGKKIAAMADAYYVTFAPHNVGGPLSTAACLHLAACTTNFKIQEHFNDFVDSWVKDAATGPGYPEVKDGYFPLPGGPGLGVTPNEDFIKEHPMQGENFNLFKEDWHRRQAKK